MSLIKLKPRQKGERDDKELTVGSYIVFGAFGLMILAAIALWLQQNF